MQIYILNYIIWIVYIFQQNKNCIFLTTNSGNNPNKRYVRLRFQKCWSQLNRNSINTLNLGQNCSLLVLWFISGARSLSTQASLCDLYVGKEQISFETFLSFQFGIPAKLLKKRGFVTSRYFSDGIFCHSALSNVAETTEKVF